MSLKLGGAKFGHLPSPTAEVERKFLRETGIYIGDTDGVKFRQGENVGAPWGYCEDAHLRNGVS